MISRDALSILDSILKYLPIEQTFDIPSAMNKYYAEDDRDDFPLIYQEHDAVFQRLSGEISTFLIDYNFAVNRSTVLTRHERPIYFLTSEGTALVKAGAYRAYIEKTGLVQEGNQLVRLDWMLDFFAIHTTQGRYLESCWKEIKKNHPTIHVEYNDSYREQMIKKLVKDGYLEYDDGLCKITWEGTLFNIDGGYSGEFNKKNVEKNRLERVEYSAMWNRKITLWLTVIIAAVGIPQALYNIQETKSINWLYSFNVMASLWIFLIGLIAGLMLYLIGDVIRNGIK